MLTYIAILIALILPAGAPGKSTGKISEADIKPVINVSSQCENLDEIDIDHLEYFDFDGDGQQEAVVVASTCMTGTAGSDIHAVYTRDAAGKVVEVPFHPADESLFNANTGKAPLFGNRNYGLSIEDRQLVARWKDSSDRENPLVVWYKWNGKELIMDHMKTEGPFRTSYDCAKATKEMDRAICYSPSVAALDVRLGQIYRTHLQQLPPDKKQTLQEQQRQWLVQRDQCPIYKWWVDCLTELYNQRIADLSKP